VFLRRLERSRRHDDIVRERVDRTGPGIDPVNPVWASVDGVDPEGEFFASIVDERIIEAIDDLPDEYRTAVVLSDVEGLPYAEIAELMDVPVGTVKSRLFRGRRQLQKVLYDYAVGMGYVSASAGAEPS
jgi:RNA polymerase sigma-70 factor (ECF subfamily)